MPSQGPLYPTTFTDKYDHVGGASNATAWSNTSNATSSNNVYATCTPTILAFSNYWTSELYCGGYGFNIPAGATIDGLVSQLELKVSSTAGTPSINDYKFTKAGVGAGWGSGGVSLTTSDALYQNGMSNSLWGTTWSPTDINDTGFGSMFHCVSSNSGRTYSLDTLSIIVYYTESGGGAASLASKSMSIPLSIAVR